jgi:hypothetical protein
MDFTEWDVLLNEMATGGYFEIGLTSVFIDADNGERSSQSFSPNPLTYAWTFHKDLRLYPRDRMPG